MHNPIINLRFRSCSIGPCATLYEEFYYLGVKLDLDEGEGDIHHNNDKVSSIRVRQGCTLTAYHNMGMTNSMFSLSEDVEVLEGDENDNMSSYKCICYGKNCFLIMIHGQGIISYNLFSYSFVNIITYFYPFYLQIKKTKNYQTTKNIM